MDSFRVLCLNLYRGRVTSDQLTALLDAAAPDVGVFQELTLPLADVVADRFAHHALHPAPNAAGRGIASKRPMESALLDLPHRPAPVATLHPRVWGQLDRPLSLVNLHMTHPLAFPPWRSARHRTGQVDGVLGHARENGDLMVVGDLNAAPGWPSYRRFRSHFEDGATLVADRHRRRPEMTWSLRPGGRALMRIDHVLVTGVTVLDLTTIRIGTSDHRALVADIASRRPT